MRRRLVLLATAATATITTAWTVAASAAFLWFCGGTWEVWEPGPFWNSAYFAHGLRWTWAWFSYAAKAPMRTAYGTELAYTGLAAAVVVGLIVFRLSMIVFGGGNRLALYGKTQWADRKQMDANHIASTRRPF
jgi:hypothetical protein